MLGGRGKEILHMELGVPTKQEWRNVGDRLSMIPGLNLLGVTINLLNAENFGEVFFAGIGLIPGMKLGKFAAKWGLTNPQLVQKSATLAERAIGGTGGVAGTAKHQYASNLLNRHPSIYGNRGLETGLYFNKGVGNRGFFDVIDHTNGIIYDFKFGKAIMSPAQYNILTISDYRYK